MPCHRPDHRRRRQRRVRDLKLRDVFFLDSINDKKTTSLVVPERHHLYGIGSVGDEGGGDSFRDSSWRTELAACIGCGGLLYGAQYIRVGIEDIFFLWPHKNDILTRTSQTVEMIVDLCQVLGREVTTVDEARKMLGHQADIIIVSPD